MARFLIIAFVTLTLITIASAGVIPERRQLSSASDSRNIPDATEIDIPPASTEVSVPASTSTTAKHTSTVTATPTPTNDRFEFDDSGEYIPPPTPDEQYYEDEGADGNSTGFINVSIGAQAGIIIAVVIVGLGIMGGCVWFWSKKQKEWKAALERRRTLRQSRIAAAKAAGPGAKKGGSKLAEGKKGGPSQVPALAKLSRDKNGSSSTVVSTEVTVVDVARSQFDVMTPTDENPSWWKKVLPKKK